MTFFRRAALRIAASVAALASCAAQAQAIDDLDLRREGADAVLQIHFAAEVQFVRAVTTQSGDFTLIYYELVGATNRSLPAAAAGRRVEAAGLPRMDVEDEVDRAERSRRMTIRFSTPVRVSVRAGKGNRAIELVLGGMGAAVQAPPSQRRFQISLQRSEGPGLDLAAPVPRALQDYEVFTSQRVVDGRAVHEWSLGYFATREDAQRALQLLGRFPQAEIVALAPAASPRAADTAPAVAASTPAPAASAPAPAASSAATATAADDIELHAQALLAEARDAAARQDHARAIALLNELLDLPPNRSSQAAQELAGLTRLRMGDMLRARAEFETYLRLYPQGEAAERLRRELAALPQPAVPQGHGPAEPTSETTVSGSSSMYYYGGNGKIRSQDFKDSPLSGLPEVAGDPTLAADKSRQLYADVDLNWRRRDAERDMRLVLRDAYTSDLERSDKSRNRLSSAYLDYKSLTQGYSVRLGRQSPSGGGVMGRFDGVQASYGFRPKWKVSAVAGVPSDALFDTRRSFQGVSVDSESLLSNLGGALYAIQQNIDGEVDRRALGLELRYFKGGVSVFSQVDVDTVIKGLNIATIQGTWILEDNTTLTALYDRRALTMLALGNALTFEDPAHPGLFTRLTDRLAGTTVDLLREQVKAITPYVTQAQFSFTTPVTPHWQLGGNVQLTSTGAIPPVPSVSGYETGRPATGSIYTMGGQLIGLNLYSSRDTHVLATSFIASPNLNGRLLSYNNSSVFFEVWQFEPSLQFYADTNPQGGHSERWTPGLRVTWRGMKRWAVESAFSWELGRSLRVDPLDSTKTTQESTSRVNYSLGARYEF